MRLTILLLASILFIGCKGTDSLNTVKEGSTAKRVKLACANVKVNGLDWRIENSSVFTGAKETVVLPKEYSLYSIDSAQMHEFFTKAHKEGAQTVVPLPKPAGCKVFKLKSVAKRGYSDGVSRFAFLGENMGQELNVVYTPDGMRAHIKWFELDYVITPVKANGKTYYVVYTKKPLTEAQKAKLKPVKRDLIEITYDK